MQRTAPSIVVVATLALAAPAAAQQVENRHTPETSGTTRPPARDTFNTTPEGAAGPSYETRMPPQRPVTHPAEHGPAQAGAPDTTRELFQH